MTWTTPPTPEPLNANLLNELRWKQHWFGTQTGAMMIERRDQGERDRQHEMDKQRAEFMIYARNDIMNEVARKLGIQTRPLISIPSRNLVGVG